VAAVVAAAAVASTAAVGAAPQAERASALTKTQKTKMVVIFFISNPFNILIGLGFYLQTKIKINISSRSFFISSSNIDVFNHVNKKPSTLKGGLGFYKNFSLNQ
jgi:hypothetical protein